MFHEIDAFVMAPLPLLRGHRLIGKARKQTSARALKQRLTPGDNRP